MLDMRAVGVGEGIERQACSGARQHRGDPGHFAGEDRVPSLQKLGSVMSIPSDARRLSKNSASLISPRS